MSIIYVDQNTGPQGVPWDLRQLPELSRILRHHRIQNVILHMDLGFSWKLIRKVPGVYIFIEVGSFKPIRIGQSNNLLSRTRSYYLKNYNPLVRHIDPKFKAVWAVVIETPAEGRFNLEFELISHYSPALNIRRESLSSSRFDPNAKPQATLGVNAEERAFLALALGTKNLKIVRQDVLRFILDHFPFPAEIERLRPKPK